MSHLYYAQIERGILFCISFLLVLSADSAELRKMFPLSFFFFTGDEFSYLKQIDSICII